MCLKTPLKLSTIINGSKDTNEPEHSKSPYLPTITLLRLLDPEKNFAKN